jgi:spermidine synthase
MRALTILVALLFALAGVPASAQQLLHQERSLYRNLFVTQSGDEICMLFRYPVPLGRESCKLKSDPNKLIFDYTQMMLAGLYLNPKPAKLLIIGEGGGTIPTALQEMYPDMQIDLVEIDAAVDRVAKRFFDFKPGPKMRVVIEDGRVFVKRSRAQNPQYSMILLDAFDADYIPEHLLTREFLQEVKSILAPDGVLVANTFSNSALYDYESVTYRAVFGPFYNLKLGNRIIIARNNGIPPIAEIRAKSSRPSCSAAARARASCFPCSTPAWTGTPTPASSPINIRPPIC